METTALTPASPAVETAPRVQTRMEAKPSGEFAEILRAKPAKVEDPEGNIPEGKDGKRPSVEDRENPLPAFFLPAVLPPEGQRVPGEEAAGVIFSESSTFGDNGSVQTSTALIPGPGPKNNSAAVALQEGGAKNSSSTAEESFPSAILSKENALQGPSFPEDAPPAKETADSSPGEKERIPIANSQPRKNPEAGEALLGTMERSARGDSALIGSEISAKEKGPFPAEPKPSGPSASGYSRTGELFGNLSSPVEGSTGLRSSGEARLEAPPQLPQPSKAGVPDQISQKLVWSLGRHEEKFRLTLDPPHLGGIYMEIQRDKEQVKATLWAESPTTKLILESNQYSIQKIIETEGFSLESFSVFVEQDLSAFQESRERMREPAEGATSGSKDEARIELGGEPPARGPFAQRGPAGLRSIDLIV